MVQEARESVTITNELGLHARAAASFVKTASKFNSDVIVKKNGIDANGKSLISLMMLTAGCGTNLEIIASGDDGSQCVYELKKLILERFGEEK